MKSSAGSGKVYFVGAGPGDPQLLTRKAWTLLSRAEVVLHDDLVPAEILRLAPAAATLTSVGKRCGRKSITQEEIHALLIEHATAGRTVVRLQGGDPLIFGRAGEEIAALKLAGVDFEIVPGVTAASAAAAAAQISLTDRRAASKLIFLSAHRGTSSRDPRWDSLPSSDATLAIYMPGRNYEQIARDLASAGWPLDTPCVIVSQAAGEQQLILRMDLHSLARPEIQWHTAAPAPALLLIGWVVGQVAGQVNEAQTPATAGAPPVAAGLKK